MQQEIEREVMPLVGLPLREWSRTADLLWLQFGALCTVSVPSEGDVEVGEMVLCIACPWRLRDGGRVLTGSGDLLTPADPAEDPETFDWLETGSSWLDVRLGELAPSGGASPPVVEAALADPFGGLRLALSGGRTIELFPCATPTGHVSTQFWRLVRPGSGEPQFLVGTFGIEREEEG